MTNFKEKEELKASSIVAADDDHEFVDGDDAAEMDAIVRENLGDQYEVLELLGRGGMGAVYKVRHRELDKIFAVKILKPELLKERANLKRFKQEAAAASKLTHANLAAVYDYGTGKAGAPFIVMDYLDGRSLDKIIKEEGFLDAPRALDLFIEAAEAIAHAHAKELIHRDIKPENLIITERDWIEHVKLVDFGIAKVVSAENAPTQNLTQTGEIFGSPMYMSPEQCQGLPLDHRTDIYALGCVMYEALTGSPPFRGDNPIQTILAHVNIDADRFWDRVRASGISEQLEHVVLLCLEKDPGDRYQTVEDLRRDLVAIRDGKQIKLKELASEKRKREAAAASTAATKSGGKAGVSTLAKSLWAGTAVLGCVLVAMYFYFNWPNPLTGSAMSDDPKQLSLELDNKAYNYFVNGQYDKAIAVMQLGVVTYEENAKKTGSRADFQLLGESYANIGECFLKLKDWHNACTYYQKSLETLNKSNLQNAPGYSKYVNDFAAALRGAGRDSDAASVQQQLRDDGEVSQVPQTAAQLSSPK